MTNPRASTLPLAAFGTVAMLAGCTVIPTPREPVSRGVILKEGEVLRAMLDANCTLEVPYATPISRISEDGKMAVVASRSVTVNKLFEASTPCVMSGEGMRAFIGPGIVLQNGDELFLSTPSDLDFGTPPDRYAVLATIHCPHGGLTTPAEQSSVKVTTDGCLLDMRLTRYSALGIGIEHDSDKPGDNFSYRPEPDWTSPEQEYDIAKPR